ncbi:MAG: hypothetical protein E7Z87_02895 [Cyanobacteria bacterium SIG26]|nr:hypothetical protein [Cyanobacteria bacterium SIG26]
MDSITVQPYLHRPQMNKFATLKPTQEDKENAASVATGAGVTAAGVEGIRKAAQGAASKRGGVAAASSVLDKMLASVKQIREATKNATSFAGKFKHHSAKYTGQALTYLKGKGMKGPIATACGKAFGGTLAFFVLASGVAKACGNSKTLAQDVKDKFEIFRTAA